MNINDTLELAKLSGIYTIINRQNNLFYIGESLDIKKRQQNHIDALKTNSHDNKNLQYDFNKYGESAFEFKVLLPYISYNTLTTKAELIVLERAFIDKYKQNYSLYNIENTLQRYLNTSIFNEENKTMGIHLKNAIIDTLLNNTLIWLEDMPMLIRELNLINIILPKYIPDIKKIVSEIPINIQNQCIEKRTIEYTNSKNNKETQTSYIITNKNELFDYLLNNRFSNSYLLNFKSIESKEKNKKDILDEIESKYTTRIPITKLYESLNYKKIIDKRNFSLNDFRWFLVLFV